MIRVSKLSEDCIVQSDLVKQLAIAQHSSSMGSSNSQQYGLLIVPATRRFRGAIDPVECCWRTLSLSKASLTGLCVRAIGELGVVGTVSAISGALRALRS